MTVMLYELVGKDDHRFSPYAWRSRLALAHKGLDATFVPCRLTDKEKIAFSKQERVPVLKDGDIVVFDSWTIACYLEDQYPDRPSLFGGPVGRGVARVVNAAADSQLIPAMARMILGDVFATIDPADREYFRRTREPRFGATIEAIAAGREAARQPWLNALGPFRLVLKEQPFLSGDKPAYADYILFGTFQWARGTSPHPLLERDDPIYAWREKMLDLFDGYGRKAKGHPVG
jgi:glutathione S-transferase